MNCSFKILWFEDDGSWYRSVENIPKQILGKHYLISECKRKVGNDWNISDLTGNDYDLILMDYKLISENTGDIIIQKIRAADVLTDVLFYSSDYDNMLKAIQILSPPIDGIYYADRKSESFMDKIEKLIEKIIRRSEDIINLRGFVLDSASDFETRIKTCIKNIRKKFNKTEKADIDIKMKEQISLFNIKEFQPKVEKYSSRGSTFSAVMKDTGFFPNSEWLVVMTNILEILKVNYGFSSSNFPDNFKNTYTDKIAIFRNALSHRAANDKTIKIKGESIPIDETLFKTMRLNINDMQAYIKTLENFAEKGL